ncbi:MAG: hypothetical protein Ct9H300mP16_16890 [Pseudomonadota bacterium]|nr:MAG: hypothetical protein Ct9H300mP16_16890 [Pseudomonadota bacterium]
MQGTSAGPKCWTVSSRAVANCSRLPETTTLKGKWPPGDYAVLKALPESMELDLPGGILAVEHGHRIWDTANYHGRLRLKYPGARVVAYGHTHVRKVDKERRPWVLNPGAAGRVRTKGGASCLLLTVN